MPRARLSHTLCAAWHLQSLQEPDLLLALGHVGPHILMSAQAYIPSWAAHAAGLAQEHAADLRLFSPSRQQAWKPWRDRLPSSFPRPQPRGEVDLWVGALGERFWNHISKVSLWTQPPLVLLQTCLCGRDCTLTVSMPSRGLSIPSLFAVRAQQALSPVTVAEVRLKQAHEHVAHASRGDESVGAAPPRRSPSPASDDAMRFLVGACCCVRVFL